jgi:hypothetical protein
MSAIQQESVIRDEFESLTRMSKERRQAMGLAARMKDAQYVAMCLGAMQALAWVLGDSAPPTISINNKVREINEQ